MSKADLLECYGLKADAKGKPVFIGTKSQQIKNLKKERFDNTVDMVQSLGGDPSLVEELRKKIAEKPPIESVMKDVFGETTN